MSETKIKRLAEEIGAESTELIGSWRGYNVHNPTFPQDQDGRIQIIGGPFFILDNSKETRLATYDEAMILLSLFFNDEED